LKLPSLGKFTSRQALPWTLGGLAAGGALYFILTGRDTGFGPLDTGLRDVGGLTHLEGVFANQEPATLKPAPGKTTVVHKGLPVSQAENVPHQTLQFSGVGEFSSFADDGRLTVA